MPVAHRHTLSGTDRTDPLRLQADAERRRSPEAPRPYGRRGLDRVELTDRQRQVLDLVAEGLENKEIAGQLGVSEQAVKQQVSVLLHKYAVPSRAMLVRTAVTMRLLGRASAEGVPYEYLFARAPVLIAMSRGPQHEFTLVNDAFVSLFGDRDYVGRPLVECFPVQGPAIVPVLDRLFATGEAWRTSEQRFLIRPPEGPEREVYLSLTAEPTRSAAGEIEGIVFYGWDVTEQVAIRQRLHRLSAEQEVLLQQLPVGVVYVDAFACPILVNPAARRLFGGTFDPARPLYDQHERWNLRLFSTGVPLDPSDKPSARAIKGWRVDDEVLIRAADGRDLRLHVSARPLHGESGAVTGAVLVYTEREPPERPTEH